VLAGWFTSLESAILNVFLVINAWHIKSLTSITFNLYVVLKTKNLCW
jgi:hypothetical protein